MRDYAWENTTGPRDRQLYEFSDRSAYMSWLRERDGLRPWCAEARYPARLNEIESYNAANIIHIGGSHVPRR